MLEHVVEHDEIVILLRPELVDPLMPKLEIGQPCLTPILLGRKKQWLTRLDANDFMALTGKLNRRVPVATADVEHAQMLQGSRQIRPRGLQNLPRKPGR